MARLALRLSRNGFKGLGRLVLSLLTLAAEARPRHSFQSRFGDRLLANLTHAEGAPVDPSQGIFNRSREATVGLVQVDLKLRFGLHCCLVNQVSPWPSRSHHWSQSFGPGGRQLVQLGE